MRPRTRPPLLTYLMYSLPPLLVVHVFLEDQYHGVHHL